MCITGGGEVDFETVLHCSPACPLTLDPPASLSYILGLLAYATMFSFKWLKYNNDAYFMLIIWKIFSWVSWRTPLIPARPR